MIENLSDYYSPQWPNHLPEGWEFVRTDWVATEHRKSIDPSSLNTERVFHYSIPIIEETGDGQYEDPNEIRSNKILLEGGEVLVSKLNPHKSRVLLSENHSTLSIASGEFIPLQADDEVVLPKYLETVFLSEPVRQYLDSIATSATRSHQRVNPQEIRSLKFPKPPMDMQRKILSFLSYQTDLIDALVDKNQRLLELLDEKKESLITNVVTRGLDPQTPLKDSGVPTIGKIPEHWDVVKLKFVATIIDCKHRTAEYVDDGIPIVRPSDIKPGSLSLEGAKETTLEEYTDLIEGGRDPRINDIIYSRNASLGVAAYVDQSEKFCLGQDICIIRPEYSGGFLQYILNSVAVTSQVESIMVGSTFNRINVEMIRDLQVTHPPKEEQKQIANYIDTEVEKIQSTKSHVVELIDLLREKRQSLITATVMGHLDVSDWEPPGDEAEVPV